MTGTLAGERSFRADRAEIARARQFAVATADVKGPVADDLALITSELATNAVLHASSDFVVRVHVSHRSVRVSVFDTDPEPPIVRRSAITDPDGGAWRSSRPSPPTGAWPPRTAASGSGPRSSCDPGLTPDPAPVGRLSHTRSAAADSGSGASGR